MTDLDFTGRTALVIGGSSGIGNGIARAFAARGADVLVTGTRASAEDYAGEHGASLAGLRYAQLDLTDREALLHLGHGLERIDTLVTCQGAVRYGRAEFEIETFRDVVEINLNSVMAAGRRFYPELKASGGSMIVISSIAAFGARRGNPAYASSKAAAVALVRTLGEAWAADGIRVNGIAPGLVPSKLTSVTTDHEGRRQKALEQIPIGRLGTPEDMAGAALFLASPLASYVIGHTIVVDGGKSLS
ncbi:SDR family NAD(P)-dependent oxidoreductase [Sphingomonas sp. BAUL-RG-20F-R05-02]|uniref:SDR family NAD(P)-dependent oxidoreductase n=1 Tax=Sphingomonas sp. BAUL-RG-20F-R05-02 TaxID=2914830 RepID=UPI001F586CEF|nr:SDR family oxidoreductase [Sphingomonas sp. BAUL-RG-20F-R05-02]